MNSIADFFVSLLRTVVRFMWSNNRLLKNKNNMNVSFKCNTGNTLNIDVDPAWDIKNVKRLIAPKLGTSPEEVKIIFAGKELQDSVVIEECDLGHQSVLHVVRSNKVTRQSSAKPTSPWKNIKLNTCVEEPGNTSEKSKEKNIHFYVFCSTNCHSLQIGKLRVRCSSCKSGAITVDSDPKSWDDVLKKKRISGCCEQEGCPDGAFGWAEFFFKCANHVSLGDGDEAIPLPSVKSNLHDVHCLSCYDIKDPVLIFSCREGHAVCIECFIQYASSRLTERQYTLDDEIGYTLPCPIGCPDSLIGDCRYFRMLNSSMYEMYQRFAAEEYVLKSGGLLCPQPGCGAGIIVTDPQCTKITCVGGCGYSFCRNCLEGYHLGECQSGQTNPSVSSHEFKSKNRGNVPLSEWERATKNVIRTSTKPCPKCRTATERDGGCMHMICTRCKYHWCWMCQAEWTRECMGSHWFG